MPGEPPTWDELDRAMQRDHRLRRIPAELAPAEDQERRAYGCGRLAVFDVCPANCVRTVNGSVVSFDGIPVLFSR